MYNYSYRKVLRNVIEHDRHLSNICHEDNFVHHMCFTSNAFLTITIRKGKSLEVRIKELNGTSTIAISYIVNRYDCFIKLTMNILRNMITPVGDSFCFYQSTLLTEVQRQ